MKYECIEVKLAKKNFESKKVFENYLKGFLNAEHEGSLKNLEVYNVMEELITKYHENPDSKIGEGIIDIITKKNSGAGYGFAIVQKNGHVKTFSYSKLIKRIGRGGGVNCMLNSADKNNSIDDAFRFTVRDQIIEFRSKVKLPFNCPFRPDILVTSLDQMHVHHDKPEFNVIIKNFLIKYNINKAEVELEGSGDNVALKDINLAKLFSDYHRLCANLIACSKQGHIEITKIEQKSK